MRYYLEPQGWHGSTVIFKERISKGGKLCLVIVPADSTVAATYFGANENDKGNSPKLTMDLP